MSRHRFLICMANDGELWQGVQSERGGSADSGSFAMRFGVGKKARFPTSIKPSAVRSGSPTISRSQDEYLSCCRRYQHRFGVVTNLMRAKCGTRTLLSLGSLLEAVRVSKRFIHLPMVELPDGEQALPWRLVVSDISPRRRPITCVYAESKFIGGTQGGKG